MPIIQIIRIFIFLVLKFCGFVLNFHRELIDIRIQYNANPDLDEHHFPETISIHSLFEQLLIIC